MANITDNTGEVLSALNRAKARALEIIGGKVESYAKALVAPRGPKGNTMRTEITAQIRNSIGHRVVKDEAIISSELDMAAYVELGTGREYQAPPEWIGTDVKPGPNSGLPWWLFYDEEQQKVRVGLPMKPTPFLRPAVENHIDEYKDIITNELKNA